MAEDRSGVYTAYVKAIASLLDIPAQLQSASESVQNHALQADRALKVRNRERAERYARLRLSAEADYEKTKQALEAAGVSIPARQRPSGPGIALTLTQAFDAQKKAEDDILHLLRSEQDRKSQEAGASRAVSDALEQRRILAQQKFEEEKRLVAEAEERRRLEEERLRAEKKRGFSFDVGGFTVTIGKKDDTDKDPDEKA